MLVPLIPTVIREVSALRDQVSTAFVPEVSPPAIAMTEDQSTILSIQIEVWEIRAVSIQIVGQAISVLNPVEVFTEHASGRTVIMKKIIVILLSVSIVRLRFCI